MAAFDLFISYRRKDGEQVLPLVAALGECGVSVWLDQRAIAEFAPITDEIRHGLAGSKALLAWYSEEYAMSRPCQMELTAAFLVAQRAGNAPRRVLVINPGPGSAHIEPVELRDAQYAAAPSDAARCASLARRIAAHVAELPGPLEAILPIAPPIQYGLKLTGASRFVGRVPDLWRVHSALHASESAIISGTAASGLAIVSGLGGVGKSLLAEEYALRFGAAYPGGLFWLRAHGNDPTHGPGAEARDAVRVEQFVTMAVAFGIDIKGLNPRQVEMQLGAGLSQKNQPFLWIIDDLASGLDADAVKAWVAPAPLGKTVITTRSREYAAIGTALFLDVLTPQESFDLLCSRRRPLDAGEQAAAAGIAQDLGYHPLALDVTAAALAVQADLVSFAESRANLANPSEDELELAADLADMLPSGHEKSVAATILRSVRVLSEDGQDFLRIAALLAVAPIPPRLVAAAFLLADTLAETEAKRRAARGQHEVEQASLAERGEAGARLVHALVSRTVRFHEGRPERCEALRTAVVTALNRVLPAVEDIRTHEVLALEVRHARALLGAREPWDADTATLAAWVARHDCERGLYSSAHGLQERVVEAQRRVLGEDHPETLSSMSSLATTLAAQGDLAGARGLHKRVLDARRRVLGAEHATTLTSMNNLAETLRAQADFGGARQLLEGALKVQRRVLGKDHAETLTSMNNLAAVLGAQGDLAGARRLQERVLEGQRRVRGAGHPDTLTSMNNLAEILRAQGDLAGARALEERLLDAQRRMLGEEHPATLTSMNNLALTLRTQGDLVGASRLQDRVLQTQRRVLGEDHPATLTSMNNLAATLLEQRDLAGARALQERVLGAQRRVLGEEHSATLLSMSNLAVTLEAQGDLAGARALQSRVLEAQRRVLGDRHESSTVSAWNLVATLFQCDEEAARHVARDNLLWLRDADPAELTASQRAVKQRLERMLSLSE